MANVIEAMRGKRSITNALISKYIDECIAVMKRLHFGFSNEERVLTYDDIDMEEGSTMHTFGTMFIPRVTGGNFILVLNQHMYDEPEDAIKNTIYHELCHYVVEKIAITLNIIYNVGGKWYYNRGSSYDIKDFRGHGSSWKRVAAIVGRATGQSITRTGSYDFHTGVGAHAETKYNYILKCKNCSREFKYSKKTKFVTAVIAGNGFTSTW